MGDAHIAMPPVVLHASDARRYSDALADVIQWFMGFEAALPEDTSKRLPSQWRRLSELNAKLKAGLPADDIPF